MVLKKLLFLCSSKIEKYLKVSLFSEPRMELYPILLFVAMCWGYGYSITFFLKNSSSFLERNLMRIGIGMGIVPIFGILISTLRIPLYWWLMLLFSLALPIYKLIKYFSAKQNKFEFKIDPQWLRITKSTIYILIVLLMFFGLLAVMNYGAFKNPWLEDGDSWGHIKVIKYMSLEKTIYEPEVGYRLAKYSEPYPIGYSLLMSITDKVSKSSYWNLKFMNVLIISLATIFFYFFVKRLTGNAEIALVSSFILTILPSFLSHFIWSKALSTVLFFPAFYCVCMIADDKRWMYPLMLVGAGILVTQPDAIFYYGLFLIIFWLAKVVHTKSFQKHMFFAGIGSIVISQIFWLQMFLRHGLEQLLHRIGVREKGVVTLTHLIRIRGSGSRGVVKDGIPYDFYSIKDFVFAKTTNMINTPVGLGMVISVLIIAAIFYIIYKIYKEKKQFFFSSANNWILLSLVWFLFSFVSVNGDRLYFLFGFTVPFPFRAWTFLAIPVCILGGYGFFILLDLIKKINFPKILFIIIVIIGLLLTSGYQKYTLNTAIWPNEHFYSFDEVQPYLWIQNNLPKNTLVTAMCGDASKLIGYDMLDLEWIREIRDFKKDMINKTAEEIYTFLKDHNYKYLTVDAKCARDYSADIANAAINNVGKSGRFEQVYSNPTGFVFRLI